MAACGLDPSRRESIDSLSDVCVRQNSSYGRAVVLTMVEFAAAMMMQVQNFNRGSFQSLNLRIGKFWHMTPSKLLKCELRLFIGMVKWFIIELPT